MIFRLLEKWWLFLVGRIGDADALSARKRILLVVLVLSIPSLFVGFFGDDYYLLLKLENIELFSPSSQFKLYDFFSETEEGYRKLDMCCMPWWRNTRFWGQ